MAQNVIFKTGTRAQFDAIATKNQNALYWLSDTQELYKGDVLFGKGALASETAAGLLSAEDYKKLQELIVSGSTVDLTPVDGSIVIKDKKIGVGLSAVDGNMLSIEGDGLYVAATKVPEYVIEKQQTAENGYSATYRLKRTLDGASTYVGDAINVCKDLVINKGSLEIATEVDVPYSGAMVGDPYIDLVLNDAEASHIYIPVKGLIDTYTAGDGIEIVDNQISVKIAPDSHGLVAVDGAMTMLLATAKQDGAMSKEDKAFIDSIPYAYVTRKYDISDMPEGTLVNYGEKEIRIMCPADAEFTKQSVGAGGDKNTYYMTFRTYAPNDSVVGYIEHLGDQFDAEVLTNLSVDRYGRKYQTTWLGVAQLNEETGVWTYYGKNSVADKFIGWDYQIDWYNANGVMIASDSIRINLSNEQCHNIIEPYYMNKYATVEQMNALEENMVEAYSWGEM